MWAVDDCGTQVYITQQLNSFYIVFFSNFHKKSENLNFKVWLCWFVYLFVCLPVFNSCSWAAKNQVDELPLLLHDICAAHTNPTAASLFGWTADFRFGIFLGRVLVRTFFGWTVDSGFGIFLCRGLVLIFLSIPMWCDVCDLCCFVWRCVTMCDFVWFVRSRVILCENCAPVPVPPQLKESGMSRIGYLRFCVILQ